MRSYQEVLKANPPNPNMMAAWIQRNTNAALASDFTHNAGIAILHYFNHPLYGNTSNLPTDAQPWVALMSNAESIIADEETWIDNQITGQNTSIATRMFLSDYSWLNQWAVANNFPANTTMSYIVNYLIASLRTCEGNNGPTGAGAISHTEHNLPNQGQIP